MDDEPPRTPTLLDDLQRAPESYAAAGEEQVRRFKFKMKSPN